LVTICIDHLAIAFHVPLRAQRLNGSEHVVGIAALAYLARTPPGALGVAPGLAGGSKGVETGDVHGRLTDGGLSKIAHYQVQGRITQSGVCVGFRPVLGSAMRWHLP